MIKLTTFAIGLLTVALIAPNAQALQSNVYSAQSIANQQAQLTVVIGGSQPTYNGNYHRTREARRLKLERERATQRRNYRYNSRYNHGQRNGSNGYYGSNNGQVNEHRDRDNHRGSGSHRDRN